LGSFEKTIIFFVTLGLFGAMLSTASTQLIVANHSIYEDIVSKKLKKPLDIRITEFIELKKSRLILILSALFSVLIVELLGFFEFSIADLMFAIYGSQLGLFAPVMLALFLEKSHLKNLKTWCFYAIIIGFISGWTFAIYGKIIDNGENFVFLSPLASLISSSIITFIGYLKYEK
jgi:Na+(H+)/acetate symporter ActP